MRRHGISNVCSRLRKFPQLSFDFHCADWARTMWSCLRVRPLLGERVLEVEQRRLATESADVAAELGRFLGLSASQVDGITEELTHRQPERTGPHPPSRFTSLEETGWDDEAVAVFRGDCGPAMAALGYGESAWIVEPDPARIPAPFADRRDALVGESYRGDVGFGNGMIGGWVQNVGDPDRRERVELLIDGIVVAEVTADRFRQDLLDAHVGDGRYAFSWPVPEATLDGREHGLALRIAGSGCGRIASRQGVRLRR